MGEGVGFKEASLLQQCSSITQFNELNGDKSGVESVQKI
jgi:hypothetical protein